MYIYIYILYTLIFVRTYWIISTYAASLFGLFCEQLLFITKTAECKGRLAAKPYDPKRLMTCQQQWCRDDIISVSIIVTIAMANTDDLNLASFN